MVISQKSMTEARKRRKIRGRRVKSSTYIRRKKRKDRKVVRRRRKKDNQIVNRENKTVVTDSV